MNILFLTGHPAQVHNFKCLKKELEFKNHKVFWIATDKDISKYLLDFYDIKYTIQKKPGKTFLSKVLVLFSNSLKVFQFIRKNKIDIIVSRVSPYAAIAGIFTHAHHLALADTESSGIYDSIFTKLVSKFITAKSFQRTLRKDQIRFDGNIELFYLHPNRFRPISSQEVNKLLGIQNNEPYVIMRFVSWDAYHDKGLQGFTNENKIKAANAFAKYARVFISAEKELPKELEPYRIKIPPEKMHDVLAHARLFFGESGTMASESAVLGRPAIYLNKNWLGYLLDARKFRLLYAYKQDYKSQQDAIEKGVALLSDTDLENKMASCHQKFMKNKIDVAKFMLWFIENYPESAKIM
ncbi:MAG: DUF354 domain-containing protein, partial [bacterium]